MLHSNISRKSGPLVDIKLTKNNTAPFKKNKNKITYRTVHPSAWSQQILHFHLCPDLWVTDTSSFLFPACPPPPSSYRSSRHAQCILPTATLNTNPCHHDNENTTQKKEAWLYIFMSLKPHTQKKKTRQHKVKIPVCIRQHSDQVLNENCLWLKSKGYGRVLFVKENLFEKSSLFLCSSLPSPLLLRFLCLSILFAFNTSAPPPPLP